MASLKRLQTFFETPRPAVSPQYIFSRTIISPFVFKGVSGRFIGGIRKWTRSQRTSVMWRKGVCMLKVGESVASARKWVTMTSTLSNYSSFVFCRRAVNYLEEFIIELYENTNTSSTFLLDGWMAGRWLGSSKVWTTWQGGVNANTPLLDQCFC